MSIDSYIRLLATQLIQNTDALSVNADKWIMVLLRLSRIVSDFLTEEQNNSRHLSSYAPSVGSMDSPITPGSEKRVI